MNQDEARLSALTPERPAEGLTPQPPEVGGGRGPAADHAAQIEGAEPEEASSEKASVGPADRGRARSRRFGRIALLVLLVGAAGLAIWYWGIRTPESRDDLGRLQGDWKLTIAGRPGPESDADTAQWVVRISGDRWKYIAGGREAKTYRITLHEEKSPKEIELTLLDAAGNPAGRYGSHGVYAIEDHTVRVLVKPLNEPWPKDLDDPNAIVWVLNRVKLQMNPHVKE